MTVRTFASKAIAGTFMAVVMTGALSACSDASGTSQSNDGTSVTVFALCDSTGDWTPTPSNFKAAQIADSLKVSEDAVKNGAYASATCNKAIPEDGMSSGDPSSIIKVDTYSPCLAIGTQQAPQTGASTTKVIAFCPGEPNAS